MTKLIQKLNKIPKSYFSLADIKKVSDIGEKSINVTISRLVKAGELTKLQKGIYSLGKINANIEWEKLAEEIYYPSYLSFEWALGYYGILSQQAENYTLATIKRSKKIALDKKTFIYHRINPRFYWGYTIKNGFLVAEPEKALLDLAYLSLNGYAKFDPEEMRFDGINKTKLKKYLQKFNNKKLEKLIRQTKII